MKRVGALGGALVSVLISSLVLPQFTAGQADDKAPQQQNSATSGKSLRDVFLGNENSSEAARTVGRLGILLKTEDGFKQVSPDHAFHNKDEFRFAITSNRDGYLYILHAAPGGSLKQLWPQNRMDNAIGAGESYEIPAGPKVFIFSGDVGQEYFYVSIRSRQTPPDLTKSSSAEKSRPQPGKGKVTPPKKPDSSTTDADSNTTNFVIRDPFGETDRDVVFKDADYLYFSSVPEESGKNALLEFQLKHID
jgi:hypothetical protein